MKNMKVSKISAPKIYLGDDNVLRNHVITYNDEGRILTIEPLESHDLSSVRMLDGYITPGFINTHCHLELSHMKSVADTGTGLIDFLLQVVSKREVNQDYVEQCIDEQDKYMWNAGIMGVGDISNKSDTAKTKSESKIQYYTFVEMFDLWNTSFTENTIKQYDEVLKAFNLKSGDKINLVPHAPYSVTPKLMRYISENTSAEDVISIHNQETPHENAFFVDGNGAFPHFYHQLNLSLQDFIPTGKPSINFALDNFRKNARFLFIHNTMSLASDVQFAINNLSEKPFWATCPNANLYIENTLPNYRELLDAGATMTIGTDSLTSNWQLSIAEEIKTILKYCSYLSFDEVIVWACKNGAEALGFDKELGMIELGKMPGLVHWQFNENEETIHASSVKRII